MGQGPKDQNSETTDFSPVDKGGDQDNVHLIDMELQPQLEDEIHSLAGFLAGAFNLSFATNEADLETSRKTTRTAEIGTLPFVVQDGVEQKEAFTRPKRVSKPSVKLIANKPHTDTLKLERLWQETAKRFLSSRELRTLPKVFLKQQEIYAQGSTNTSSFGSRLYVKHGSHADSTTYLKTSTKKRTVLKGSFEDGLGDNVFACTKCDNKPGISVEDWKFIHIMNSSLARNEFGSWRRPYLSVKNFNRLPNNREDAVKTVDETALLSLHADIARKRSRGTYTENRIKPFYSTIVSSPTLVWTTPENHLKQGCFLILQQNQKNVRPKELTSQTTYQASCYASTKTIWLLWRTLNKCSTPSQFKNNTGTYCDSSATRITIQTESLLGAV